MTGLYVMAAISIALALACVALCVQLLRKNKQKFDDAGILSVKEDNEKLKNDIDTAMKINNSMLVGTLNAGCPRYERYRCCHRHAGFPAFEPAFDLDRLCGLPSEGSGTPAHRGDLDTVGGRFMFIFRVQRRA